MTREMGWWVFVLFYFFAHFFIFIFYLRRSWPSMELIIKVIVNIRIHGFVEVFYMGFVRRDKWRG